MALPTAAPGRKLKHKRHLDVQIFSRADGLWEVDARVTDTRTDTVELASGPRIAGEPIHDMLIRLVVDRHFDILESGAQSLSTPYPSQCDTGDAYRALAGLNLMQGFRRAVQERFGGVRGCTHINELAQVLPTAVVQAFAGEVLDTRGDGPGDTRPFQIDRCHALRSDGAVVRTYYPRWYRAPEPPAANPSEPERARTS